MNWLVITSPAQGAEAKKVMEFLSSKEATPECITTDTQLSADALLVVLERVTHCVMLLSQEYQNLHTLLYATGYLHGKSVPTFATFFADDKVPDEATELIYKKFKNFGNTEELIGYLDEIFPSFQAEEDRKKAHKKLFDEGIPFTPDAFSTYVARNDDRVAQLFLDAGMDINSRDSAGTPMLSIAARSGRSAMIAWLVHHGSEIDAVTADRGYSAVMDAVWKGSAEIVEQLIGFGANLNIVGNDGQTALIIATGASNAKICRLLVEHGADPSVKDRMGMSALQYAELFRQTELAELYKEYLK